MACRSVAAPVLPVVLVAALRLMTERPGGAGDRVALPVCSCQHGGRCSQRRQERASVAPSTAMQNDADGHDTDVRPMPEFTIVGADHDLPL